MAESVLFVPAIAAMPGAVVNPVIADVADAFDETAAPRSESLVKYPAYTMPVDAVLAA
jgi:hypothetical protein